MLVAFSSGKKELQSHSGIHCFFPEVKCHCHWLPGCKGGHRASERMSDLISVSMILLHTNIMGLAWKEFAYKR